MNGHSDRGHFNYGQSNYQPYYGQSHYQPYNGQAHYDQSHHGQSHYGQSHYGQSHYGQSHYGQSNYGHDPGYEDSEEMVELTARHPPAYRHPNTSNSFGLQLSNAHASAMATPRPPAMPYRPGHAREDYGPPGSPCTLQPTPRSSTGPDSFTNTPYDSRSASPTLVSLVLLF